MSTLGEFTCASVSDESNPGPRRRTWRPPGDRREERPMKIAEIRAMRLTLPPRARTTTPRRPSWAEDAEVANPMSRYPRVKRHRSLWLPPWENVWCKVTAEDGSWGLGMTAHGRAVAAVIDDHLAPQLASEDCLAVERLADMMFQIGRAHV